MIYFNIVKFNIVIPFGIFNSAIFREGIFYFRCISNFVAQNPAFFFFSFLKKVSDGV